jgi:phospholipase/carboxylesterase
MPANTPHTAAAHPVEGFRSVALPGAPARPARVYLPTDYQPKYAYPLVVLFHADGECEDAAVRLVPQLSRRNYVALCLRGGVKRGRRPDGRITHEWAAAADPGAKAALAHALSNYSVHPERVFLMGVGEGASAACRFALSSGVRAAGLIALNGVPAADRIPETALRVFVAHGAADPVVPFAAVRRAAAKLTAAGASVRVTRYPAAHRVHADMLRDANRWIMAQVAAKR